MIGTQIYHLGIRQMVCDRHTRPHALDGQDCACFYCGVSGASRDSTGVGAMEEGLISRGQNYQEAASRATILGLAQIKLSSVPY